MSFVEQNLNEQQNKYKLNHQALLKKKNIKDKYEKQNVYSKYNDYNKQKESNFQICKRLGLLKRNSAQDRLKKIRNNTEIKKKISDSIKKLQCHTDDSKERSKEARKFLKTFLATDEFLTNNEYSADARLRKIKKAVHKNIPPDDNIKNLSTEISFSKNSHNFKSTIVANYTPTKLFDENCMKMDIDNEENEVNEPETSYLPHTYSDNASTSFISSDSKNDTKNWNTVTKSNTTYMNKEISKIRQEPSYLALHENFMSDIMMNLTLPVGDLFIVVDTNIFLSNLDFVAKLLKYKIQPYKSAIVVVPWLVIQEIDYVMKKDNSKLAQQAKAVNKFIYDCLKFHHPKFFGQSLEDFKINFKNAVCVDDYILQYCLKLVSLKNNVILLTNDINLSSKAMVNQLTVFTEMEFEKNFILLNE